MSNTVPPHAHGPLVAVPEDSLPAWAIQVACGAGLGKAAREYPEQVVRAAASARDTLKALQDDMPGTARAARPTWSLSK